MKPYIPNKLPFGEFDYNPVVHLISKANRQISKFDGFVMNMPNPHVLLSSLTTNEAVLSSRIEGTQATFEEVLEFEADPKNHKDRVDDIQEIINYRKTLTYAIKRLSQIPLSARLTKEMHAILLDSVRGQGRRRGEFRTSQVHIGPPGCTIEEATFVPPSQQLIPRAFTNLEKYFHHDEKDCLVQAAIVHAQFEIIHPFFDGNGRMGRLLIPLFLFYKKVLSYPSFYMSEYFNANKTEYYDSLNIITHNDNWTQWIHFFLEAIINQAENNIDKGSKILQLYNSMKDRIVELTHSQFAISTLDFIFNTPIFSAVQFRNNPGMPKPSAARILNKLREGHVVKIIRKSSGRRPAIFAFSDLLSIVR